MFSAVPDENQRYMDRRAPLSSFVIFSGGEGGGIIRTVYADETLRLATGVAPGV
jgi:hypothetical protein